MSGLVDIAVHSMKVRLSTEHLMAMCGALGAALSLCASVLVGSAINLHSGPAQYGPICKSKGLFTQQR